MGWLTCIRPSTGNRPAVELVSETEFTERVRSDANEGVDESDLAREIEWNRGLALFGLAPEQYDRDEQLRAHTADVTAAYFRKGRRVLVIDRGEPTDDRNAVTTLVHEFVHALQDSELDLDRYTRHWGKTYDSALAITGLTEGEAVHYMLLASIDERGLGVDDVDWKRFYDDWRVEELQKADVDPAPVDNARMRFPYAFGGGFMTQHWLIGGRQAIERLFEKPPRSTHEILFGPTEDDLAPFVRDARGRGLPALGPAFELQDFATLGSWLARIYARRIPLPAMMQWQLSQALAGDVFTVQRNTDNGQTVATWHLAAVPGLDLKLWSPGNLTFVSTWNIDQAREWYAVATRPGIPAAPETLEWGNVDMPEMPETQAETSVERSFSHPHARLCASHFPHQLLLEHVRR